MQTDDNETEKADSTKDEKEKIPEVVARNFGDRLASFFRINKSFNMEDEKLDDEKDTDESEQVPEVIAICIFFFVMALGQKVLACFICFTRQLLQCSVKKFLECKI